MTTVTQQPTAASPGLGPASMGILTSSSSHPREVKAYVLEHEKIDSSGGSQLVETTQRSSGRTITVKTKTVSFSDTRSPPPPPTRISSSAGPSRGARPAYKEEVVLRRGDQEKQASPVPVPIPVKQTSPVPVPALGPDPVLVPDAVGKSRGGEVNASNSLSNGEGVGYVRQRSRTETLATLTPVAGGGRVEGGRGGGGESRRGQDHRNRRLVATTSSSAVTTEQRFNPYTGTMLTAPRPLHSKFSVSQPQLNAQPQDLLVKPNDRIRKSMFDDDEEETEIDQLGADYGSGYRPTLMKISHGDIQKHAVAVTTPVAPVMVPVSKMNRAESDPNILEGRQSNARDNSPNKLDGGGPAKQEATNRKQRHSSTSGTGSESGTLTSDIARAYREYLMEKMEKEKKTKSSSPGASSGQDMTDHASPPQALPPGTSKHEQLGLTLENGAQQNGSLQPFQPNMTTSIGGNGPQSAPYNAALAYGTLPRNRDVNWPTQQGMNTGIQYRAQSVNELYNAAAQSTSAGELQLGAATQQLHQQLSQVGAVGLSFGGYGGANQSSQLYHPSHDILVAPESENWREESLHSQTSSYGASYSPSVSSQLSSATPYSPDSAHTTATTDGSEAGSRMGHHSAVSGGAESSLDSMPRRRNSQGSPHHGGQKRPPLSSPTSITTKDAPSPTNSLVAVALGKLTGQVPTNYKKPVRKPGKKPPVMPKPAGPRRNNAAPTTTPPSHFHERSTSDPAVNPSHSASSVTMPNSSGLSASPKHSSRLKHRVQQISNSLIEIREADEQEGNRRSVGRRGKAGGKSQPSLYDYVSLNSAQLPKRVRVGKGFCTGSTEVTFSQGEEFDLHFVRQIKAAILTDSNGVRYSVPLNSASKFAVVYDPFGVEKVATTGFQFRTASVLMDLRNPPNVVSATVAFDGGSPESSVEPGEVLVLDGIKNVFHGRLLKAHSLSKNATKYLDERCLGNFTTRPDALRMTLAQVYERSVPLPQKVMLYPEDAIAESVPLSVRTNPLVLRQFVVSKTVIATTLTALSENVPVAKLPAVNIFLDMDIEVSEVPVTERQAKRTRERTQALLDSFAEASVTPYVNMPSTASYVAQCAFLRSLDPKLEAYDAENLTPNSFVSPVVAKKRRNSRKLSQQRLLGSVSSLDPKAESRLRDLELKYDSMQSKVTQMCQQLENVSAKVNQVHTYLTKAQDAMNRHRQKLQETSPRPAQVAVGGGPGLERKGRQSSDLSSSASNRRISSSVSDNSAGRILNSKPQPPTGSGSGSGSGSGWGSGSGRCITISSISNSSSHAAVHPRLRSKSSTGSESGDAPSTSHATPAAATNDNDNDDVFAPPPPRPSSRSGGPKPPTLPKPKNLKRALDKKSPTANEHAQVSRSSSAGSKYEGNGSSSSSNKVMTPVARVSVGDKPVLRRGDSSPVVPPLLRKASSRDSLDLKDYLLESIPKEKGVGLTERSNSELEELGLGLDEIDAMTDWCSQVEDELTQLYNDSILSLS